MERYESASSTEAPQAAEASSLPYAHDEEVAGPHSSDAGLDLQQQERPSGAGRKRVRRTISPPVPPPSPFLPYSSSDFSVPMEKVLSSQLSRTTTNTSSDHGHASALKYALPPSKAADDWRSMLALTPETASGGSQTSSRSSGRFQRLFACFGTGAVYV